MNTHELGDNLNLKLNWFCVWGAFDGWLQSFSTIMTNQMKYIRMNCVASHRWYFKKIIPHIKRDLSHSQENFSLDKMIYGTLGFYLILSFSPKPQKNFYCWEKSHFWCHIRKKEKVHFSVITNLIINLPCEKWSEWDYGTGIKIWYLHPLHILIQDFTSWVYLRKAFNASH